MGLISTLGSLLIFIGLYWICTGFEQENCTNYKIQFERVFSVPGDMAMLNSTLVSPDVFDITTLPYSITWYDSRTGHEMSNQTGRTLVHGETLWFLNATPEDSGEYVTILRTHFHCYMQATSLVVEPPIAGECGRPRKVDQSLTLGVADTLSCPLKDYINKLDSYNISSSLTWYRGCEPIVEGKDGYSYRDRTKISIKKVEEQHNSTHTCTLTFTLGGITGSVSETIEAAVTDVYSMVPQVHEPANEIIKAQMGSNFTKRCRVFVPGIGMHFIDVIWSSRDYIFSTDPSDRVYTSEQRSSIQHSPKPGLWLERLLTVSELREEDFQINYTCIVFSSRGMPQGYFTLLPADPNIIVPIGSMFGGVTVLFIICVIIYYLFKVDIVLWFRRVFPVLYTNTDLDGKLYDAYVAYPPPGAIGFTEKVETFALHTLPQVLEKACDYKLFIAGRDCQPGQAIVDSVEENIQASRRLLLLYTASTFASKRHTSSTSSNNNNNFSKNINSNDNSESKTSDNSSSTSFDGSDEVYPDTRQQLECVAAMHRVLLEGSLKVVLVELEEITPAQLALFPESVRHLRKKQGAVRWWKNLRTKQRRRTCMRRREDEETGEQDTQLSPSLSPSSKFWKEMRYYMPVRGKRAVYPEKTALLNMKGL